MAVRLGALFALAAMPLAGCAGGRPALSGEAAAWASGPVRWLLLPDEERALAALRNPAAGGAFREAFWRRRDPTPDEPGNPALDLFVERVGMADRLYGRDTTSGSLTPRGRALILLGPPSRLRLGPSDAGAAGRSDRVVIERWGWTAADLPPRLAATLPPPAPDGEWRVAFRVDRGGDRLVEGEALLRAAARGWTGVGAGEADPGGRGSAAGSDG